MSYIAGKNKQGLKVYLSEDGTWTPDSTKAKEYKGRFWIELLKVLLSIAKAFGITNIKFYKR